MVFRYTTVSRAGKNNTKNSDFVLVNDFKSGWFGIVCDGMGELGGIEQIAKQSAEAVYDFFIEDPDDEDVLKRIKSSIDRTNKEIHSRYREDVKPKGIASTIVLLVIRNYTAYIGNVGDSRIYKLKNNQLLKVTKDHSMIQHLLDKGFLTVKQAILHPAKNVVRHAIGEKDKLMIDVSKISIYPYDKNRFFLCSDGVTAVLSDKEIETNLAMDDINVCSERFSKMIIERDYPDDYSYIILDIQPANPVA